MNDNRRMLSRLAAFVIWAAIAASIVFWSMRLWVKPMTAPEHATLVASASGFNGDLSRLFGADTPPAQAMSPNAAVAPADARFKLIGVVAPRSAGAKAEGLALIAFDGKPARAYRVGAAVDGELVLQEVHARGASLGPSGQAAQVSLELPALPPPNSGTMPGSAGLSPMPRPPVAMPRPLQPPAAAPQPEPPPTPAESTEPEPRPDPSDRPMHIPPTGADRPPT